MVRRLPVLASGSAAPAPPRGSWLHRTSVVEKLTTVVLVFVVIIVWLMLLGAVSLKLSSGVRAYVAGEGLWTRAQKDAVLALHRYAATGAPGDFAAYEQAILVTMGDRMARLELARPDYDAGIVARGFLQGGNHARDIPDMIFLVRHFGNVRDLREALEIWAEGDALVDVLGAQAEALRQAVMAEPRSAAQVAGILEEIGRTHEALGVLELRFSSTLAAGARRMQRALLWVAGAGSLVLLALGVLLARRVGAQVRSGIAELQRGTARVAAGDYTRPIIVESADELGALAAAFNEMVRHRREAAQAIEDRLRFENLVTRLSSQLTLLRPVDVDVGVRHALADIGSFAGVDRTCVFWFDESQARVSCSHEWCAPGIPSMMGRLQDVPTDAFPWLRACRDSGRVVHVPRVADLPPEAAAERAEWEHESVRSVLMVPMRTGDTVRGYVCLVAVRREKSWTQEAQDLLRIFGEIVLNTLRRVNAELALRERNQKLAAAVQELERSNAELEEFAYVASHDLKTPLRGISGFLQLLERRCGPRLDREALEYVELARASVRHMHGLVGGLLELSSIGKRGAATEPTDCNAVLRAVTGQLAAAIAEREAEVSSDPLPVVPGTPHEIHQMFQNLVGNALKFQPGARPRVHVGAMREGDHWKLWVRDWGIGIKAEHQQRIFQIFQRLHLLDQFEGSGIGLSICRKIVHRHGGRIWVESEEGKGSTFYFTLRA